MKRLEINYDPNIFKLQYTMKIYDAISSINRSRPYLHNVTKGIVGIAVHEEDISSIEKIEGIKEIIYE